MLMYNFIEHSSNYSETASSNSKDKATTFEANVANNDTFKSFEYKAKYLWNTIPDGNNYNSRKCNSCCTIKICK